MMIPGATVFVTGGSGFIGGRLIEVLVGQYGMKVKALVRGGSAGSGAFRAAAAGADFVAGSLLDEASLVSAMAGCDYVFHCAYGSHGDLAEQRRVTVEGSRTLARAAAAVGVKHFVNLSTLVTFGADPPAVVDERYVPRNAWRWPYAIDKRDAEIAVTEEHARSGIPTTTLRLGPVYGPYGPAFTVGPIATLRAGRMALINDGRGVSNAVYVDDVIQAMTLAAGHDGTGAGIYTICGPDRVTWRAFYEVYEKMLGLHGALVPMTRESMRSERRKAAVIAVRRVVPEMLSALKSSSEFKRTAGALPMVRKIYAKLGVRSGSTVGTGMETVKSVAALDNRPIQLIPDMMLDYYASTTDYRIDLARAELGYAPQYDLARGMEINEQWARWANLVP